MNEIEKKILRYDGLENAITAIITFSGALLYFVLFRNYFISGIFAITAVFCILLIIYNHKTTSPNNYQDKANKIIKNASNRANSLILFILFFGVLLFVARDDLQIFLAWIIIILVDIADYIIGFTILKLAKTMEEKQ